MFEVLALSTRILEFFMYFKLAEKMMNKQLSNVKMIITSILCTIIFAICSIFFHQSMKWISSTILVIICFKLLSKENLTKILLVWVKILILLSIMDTIITFLFLKVFNISDMSQITYDSELGLIGRALIVTLLLITYIVICFTRKDKNISVSINEKSLVVNAVVTFILLVPNLSMLVYYYFSKQLPLILVIINIIAITLMFIVSNANTQKYIKLAKAEEELITEKTYNKTLQNLVDGLRTFKHDYNNTLQTIYGYILTDNMTELKTFFADILDESRAITALDKLNPELFRNPSLFGLVTAKFEYARASNVTMNFEIYADLDNLDIKTYDFTRTLGIFLDNAIEASAGSKKKIVNFYVIERNGKVTIDITNSYSTTGMKIEDMEKKGVSSKGEGRGLGLYKVKEILSKYPNIKHETNAVDEMFLQRLVIEKVKQPIR